MALLDFGTRESVPQINMIMSYTKTIPTAGSTSTSSSTAGSGQPAQLFLGSATAAASKELILAHQIAAVLTISGDSNLRYPAHIIKSHKTIPLLDTASENIAQYFDESIAFIEENLSQGRNVLVHCVAGVSRSPTIVIAYVINHFNWSFQRAFDFVKTKRSIINPNVGFIAQLRKLDSNGRVPLLRKESS